MEDLRALWTPAAAALADVLARSGASTRVVGGAVRDAIAGLECHDTDLCTDATPDEMLAIGERLGLRTIPTAAEVRADPGEMARGGLKHGTVPFVIEGEVVEVTTLRRDVATDGRHAEVAFVRDFREDAARRDFTFNAMSVDRRGVLHDYFGGEDDLRRGIVRFVGDAGERIREDYLRILRYFRFRGRFATGTPPDDVARREDLRVAFSAIAAGAAGLSRVSGERVWQEMSRILARPGCIDGPFMDMASTGVAQAIGLPVRLGGIDLARAAAQAGARPAVVAGLLASGGGLPEYRAATAETLAGRWRMGGEDAALLLFAGTHVGMADAPYADFLDLALAPRGRPELVSALLTGFGRSEEAALVSGPLPEFPVRGADLVEAGVPSGPGLGAILARLRAEWRDSGYSAGRDELLASVGEGPARAP